VPDAYSVTTNGVSFLFSDTLVHKKRVILFASEEQQRMLFSSTHIMIDGTFSACVPHFDQVFSIHCMEYGYSKLFLQFFEKLFNRQLLFIDFPCVIGLLPCRTVSVYKHIFNLLGAAAERLNLTFEPEHIMSDYESALIKTIASHVNRTSCIGSILYCISISFSFGLQNIQVVIFITVNVCLVIFRHWD
jgi:hypothetical protein